MELLSLVLAVGLSARLTRLVMVDDAGVMVRRPLMWLADTVAGDGGLRFVLSLLNCPFCIGFWVSVAVVASWALVGHTVGWQLVAGAFTLNYVQAHLNALLDLGETDDR